LPRKIFKVKWHKVGTLFGKIFNKVEQKVLEGREKDKIRNLENPLTGDEIMTALILSGRIYGGY